MRVVKQPHEAAPEPVAPGAPQTQSPPSALAAAAAASADELALFEGQVRLAVQRAVVYPMGARAAHEIGRAQVAFTLRGDRADNPALAQSSGFPVLDRAALAAVRDAHYPSPPAKLAGRDMHFLVWVEFQRGGDD